VSRSKRKLDHINHAITSGQARTHGFEDIQFIHNSIPNIAMDEICLQTKIGELHMSSPIFINAMTGGGGTATFEINKQLAEVAQTCSLPMAVGSQMAALKDKSEVPTYKIIREVNKEGIVFANLGSEATVDQAKQAVEMIDANALQIHLNVIQELVMPEGDRDFTGALNRIENIINTIDVPVIIKEVGFGMSHQVVNQLIGVGVSAVDVGGYGGTNFASIENFRRNEPLSFFNDWGITTAASIVEARVNASKSTILASGGMQNSMDIAKAIALGANAVGFAGYFLKILKQSGQEALVKEILDLKEGLRMIMTALGTKDIPQLQQTALVFSGNTKNWLVERGINTKEFAQKK
jgi:isopentenyl-diphosphate Delta-isomerase